MIRILFFPLFALFFLVAGPLPAQSAKDLAGETVGQLLSRIKVSKNATSKSVFEELGKRKSEKAFAALEDSLPLTRKTSS